MEKVVSRKVLFTERLCTGISCNECSFNEVDGEPGCLLGKRIEELPFFTIPERQTGTWKCYIHSAYHGVDEYDEPIWRDVKVYHCRFCNRRTVIKENFCPSCGADMREGSE